MDYGRTALAERAAEGLVDDYFCALIEEEEDLKIREFVVGDTDMPLFEWCDKHGISTALVEGSD